MLYIFLLFICFFVKINSSDRKLPKFRFEDLEFNCPLESDPRISHIIKSIIRMIEENDESPGSNRTGYRILFRKWFEKQK